MSDSDFIQQLFRTADPAKAELASENERLRNENARLRARLIRAEREKEAIRAEREREFFS